MEALQKGIRKKMIKQRWCDYFCSEKKSVKKDYPYKTLHDFNDLDIKIKIRIRFDTVSY